MLKYILLFFVIYMIVRFFRRMSILFSKGGSGSGSQGDNRNRRGSFITDTRKQKKKFIPKDEGDYVDYEEVD